MPTIQFTDRSIASLSAPARGQVDYFDARVPGFGLRVTERGHKAWIVMYRITGRLRRLTLGPYPRLLLADARGMAKLALAAALRGQDLAAEKQAGRLAESFGDLAALYIEQHAKPKKRSWKEDDRVLTNEALPRWRNRKVKDLTYRDVQQVLDAICQRGAPIAANRTLALLRKVFNFAIARRIIPYSPCQGIERPARERQRDRVLSPVELSNLWCALLSQPLWIRTFFQLQLLTAQRGGEVRRMQWDHLDLESGWWTIPSSDAKNRLAHRVPLSPAVVRVLGDLERPHTQTPWVFASERAAGPRHIGQKILRAIRKQCGLDFWPHDLRRTAASHMTSLGIPRLTVAKILNHAERGITAVYDRHSYDSEKRQALEAWAVALQEMLAAKGAPPLAESHAPPPPPG